MSTAALRRSSTLPALDVVPLLGLTLATALATVWAISAAAWNDGTTIALATTAVAVAEAALIASSTGGRITAALSAPVLGVLVIVPLTIAGMSAGDDGLTGVRHVAVRYAHALPFGLLDTDSWSFNVGLCAGMWLLGFWAGWMVVRERRGAFAVLPCYAVLAVNAVNAPSLDRVAFPEAVAVAASLLLLARTHLAALEVVWRRQRVVALPGTRRRYTVVALAAVVAAVLGGAVLPPATTADVSARIFHFNLGDLGHGSGSGSGSGPGAAPATISFSPNTIPGGALVDNPQAVLSYTTDSTENFYLRVVDDTVFDNGNWFPALDTGRLGRVDVGVGTIPRDRDPAHGGAGLPGTSVTIKVVFDAAAARGGDNHAPFAGDPEAVGRAGTAFGADGLQAFPAVDASHRLITVDMVRLQIPFALDATVTTTGVVPTATLEQLRSAGRDYPLWIQTGGLLDLGSNDQRQLDDIRALAQSWVGASTNAYDQARAIEAHLRTAPFTYTLSPPATPSGEWPIHAFLLRTHRGYCQYYASAMGTMLRLLGIPTRLVSGYGAGTADDSNGAAKRLHAVTSSDAHVWVEAYFPHYGWIPFEPTPSTQYGDYQPIPRPSTASAPSPAVAVPATPTPAAATPRPSPTPGSGAAVGSVTGPTIPMALLGFFLGALAIMAVVVGAVGWMARPSGQLSLWRRLRLVGRLVGVRRRSSETQSAYTRRVIDALPGDGTSLRHRDGAGVPTGRRIHERAVDALSTISQLSGKANFSRRGLAPEEEMRWRRAWARLCSTLPVLLWRRLIARRRGMVTHLENDPG